MLLAGWLVHGIFASFLWAGVIALATWPWYRKFRESVPDKAAPFSPLLFSLLVALLFLAPLAYAFYMVGHEGRIIASLLISAQKTGLPPPDWLEKLPFVGHLLQQWWFEVMQSPGGVVLWLHRFNMDSLLEFSRHLGLQMLHRSIIFLLALFILFFLYRDGEALAARALQLIHQLLGDRGISHVRRAVDTIRATVNGLVLVGLIEGFFLGIAYAVAGIPSPTLWGAATGIFAMIPLAMPAIFGAASLILFAQGNAIAASLLFVWGLLVLFVGDHVIRPAIISGAVRLSLLWILLGIIGGIDTFGLIGLFIGPAIMATLVSLWREWTEEGL